MAFYQDIVSSRTSDADMLALITTLRGLDASASCVQLPGGQTYRVKKATAWTAPQTTAATNAVNAAASLTLQSVAQTEIDNWPISLRALVLTLIDQLNVLRALQSLPAITPVQALTAIRTKAGTL